MLKPFKALALAGAMISLVPAPAAAQPQSPPPGAFADVDGGRLYYETCGTGPQTIVLLHDGVLHSVVWDGVWPTLCGRFQVIRYDRRGYGRSPEAKAPYSRTTDLAAVLKAAGISHAVLVGSSNGGGLAVDFALAHPEMVDKLVLVGPSVTGIPYSQHFVERGQEVSKQLVRDPLGAIKSSWLLAPGHDADARMVLRLVMANLQDLTHKDPAPLDPPAARRLGEIKAPTLILVGEADIADNQAQAGVLEYAVPHARRVVVRDAGHLMYLEHPDAFAKLVTDFVEAPDR
jgi:pimeloyl-ACP methyl ester carboxylesterase